MIPQNDNPSLIKCMPLMFYRPICEKMRSGIVDVPLGASLSVRYDFLRREGYLEQFLNRCPAAAVCALTYVPAINDWRAPQNIEFFLSTGKISAKQLLLTCIKGPVHKTRRAIEVLEMADYLDCPAVVKGYSEFGNYFEFSYLFSYAVEPLRVPQRQELAPPYIQAGMQIQLDEIPFCENESEEKLLLDRARRNGTLL